MSQNDLFPLSFYFGLAGPPRAGAGIQFRSELAAAWSPAAASTADMNGDGRINQNDLFPLGFNYGRSRAAGAFFSASREPSCRPRLSAAGSSARTGTGAMLVGTPSASELRAGDTLRVAVRIAGAGAARAVGFQMRYDRVGVRAARAHPRRALRHALARGDALDLTKLETGRVSYAATLTGAGSVGDGEVVVVRLRVRAGAGAGVGRHAHVRRPRGDGRSGRGHRPHHRADARAHSRHDRGRGTGTVEAVALGVPRRTPPAPRRSFASASPPPATSASPSLTSPAAPSPRLRRRACRWRRALHARSTRPPSPPGCTSSAPRRRRAPPPARSSSATDRRGGARRRRHQFRIRTC